MSLLNGKAPGTNGSHSNTIDRHSEGTKLTSLSLAEEVVNEVRKAAPAPSQGLKAFEHLRITDTTQLPPRKVYDRINGEVIAEGGDLIVYSGGVKSGKSSYQDQRLASAITRNGIISDPIEIAEYLPNREGYAVIHIDTEQSKAKHQRKIKSVLKIAGLDCCPDHYLSYNLRELDVDQYEQVTTAIIQAAAAHFGGVYMVLIDGIADYIQDPNDTKTSNAIVKYFEKLAIEYNCPVYAIIHTNPNSDKERGNLGSQCLRKAASILGIKSEGDVSYMEAKYLRNGSKAKVPVIEFTYSSEKGYHVPCGYRDQDEKSMKQPLSNTAKLKSLADQVFPPLIALEYQKAIAALMVAADRKERTCKDIFKEMHTLDLITKGSDERWRRA